jgi:hypothetical protein
VGNQMKAVLFAEARLGKSRVNQRGNNLFTHLNRPLPFIWSPGHKDWLVALSLKKGGGSAPKHRAAVESMEQNDRLHRSRSRHLCLRRGNQQAQKKLCGKKPGGGGQPCRS